MRLSLLGLALCEIVVGRRHGNPSMIISIVFEDIVVHIAHLESFI